jgi:hypothetical protein
VQGLAGGSREASSAQQQQYSGSSSLPHAVLAGAMMMQLELTRTQVWGSWRYQQRSQLLHSCINSTAGGCYRCVCTSGSCSSRNAWSMTGALRRQQHQQLSG